jgi:hypothetical protein
VANPCDLLGRPHVYPPLWLHLDVLPITTAWTAPVGLLLDLAFLASLPFLPPARRPYGVLIMTAAVLSPAVAYALERANNDVLIFLAATLIGWLATRSAGLRLLGHGVTVLAAALKLYPLTLLILAWREQWPRGLVIMALAVALLAAILWPDFGGLMRGLRLVPSGAGDSFGAINIPQVLAAGSDWPPWVSRALELALLGWMVFRAWGWSLRLQPGLADLSVMEQVFLTVGATLIVSCFVAGQSAYYRAIHLLLALPGLLSLSRQPGAGPARLAPLLVVVLMWASAWRAGSGWLDLDLWMIQQCVWWVLVTMLTAALLALLRESAAFRSLPFRSAAVDAKVRRNLAGPV